MLTTARLSVLLVLALLQVACGGEDAGPATRDLEASGRRFVDLLVQGEFEAAVADFDETMTRVMPPDKLKGAWTSVVAKAGPFKEQLGVELAKVREFDIVLVTCQFENGPLDVKVVFSETGQIAGLWFSPAGSSVEYQAPEYVNQDAFEEQQLKVGSGIWSLPGTLNLPKGKGPFPALVLVHGSGPNDRDETVGPNKPFRDLAWGMASRGIAVLRYEKRTKEHKWKLVVVRHNLTVKEETIDDALAAVSLLRSTDKIDSERIFVLGHSLGGMLVPRIGARDSGIAGFIVLAGTSRPLEDVILDQSSYIASLDGEVSEDESAAIEKLKEQVVRVKGPELTEQTAASDLPLGAPAKYWLDLRDYDPPEAAKRLQQPMLLLHAGRDYQVTTEDFDRWQKALSSRDTVQFKVYPKCNHLFIEGEGQCTPAEYEKAGHVAKAVIEDIAEWIGRN
jgi:dienelactone hydrolase